MAHHALVSVQGDGRLHCCITQTQLQDWVRAFQRQALPPNDLQHQCVVGIALRSCSIEESAVMLALAQSTAAVYVPIDVSLPVTQQVFILQDARVQRLVTSPDSAIAQVLGLHQHQQQLPVLDQALLPLVLVTNVDDSLQHASSAAPESSGIAADSLHDALYIMYTSGSTGKPKGIIGTRAGAWNRLRWMWAKYPFQASTCERVLRATKLSFVDSVWEILGALEQQIPLVHIRNDAAGESVILRDRSAFLLVMQRWKITRLTVIPSVLELLVRPSQEMTAIASTLGTAAASHLRYLLISGEPLPLNVLLACSQMLPGTTLLNLYGSTEVSGDITWAEFQAPISSTDLALWSKHGVPIGRRRDLSVGDASLMLVNGDDRLVLHDPRDHTLVDCERAFTGELLVKSRGVSSGYVSTELSSAHEWFRMGDTCQALGAYLFFCGRNDDQVKVRGMRLNLHAVECALAAVLRETSKSAFAGSHVAVIAVKDASVYALEHQRLIACILTGRVGSDLEHEGLQWREYPDAHSTKQRVRAEYGNAYVPDDVFLVDHELVKRLPQGKLDKRALETQYRELSHRKPRAVQQPAAAKQELSCVTLSMKPFLLEQVKQVMRLDQRNAEELSNMPTRSFFELGGNSMLATLLCWDVKDRFNVVISPDQMLHCPLERLLTEAQTQPLVLKSSRQLPVVENVTDSNALPIEPPNKRQRREATQSQVDPPSRMWSVGRLNQTTLSAAAFIPTCHVANARSQSLGLAFAWKVDLGKCIDASPLVIQRATGRSISTWAIVGSHSARIACIDVNSGVTIWHRELDDRIEACTALSVKNEFIYVGTYSGALYALNVVNGDTQWCFSAGGLIKSTAVVLDCYQLVVCGAYNHVLYGLDSLTGAERWTHDMRGSVFSTPIFVAGSSNRVFSASTSGYVCALAVCESNSVSLVWENQLPAPVFASLNVDESTELLLVGCADGNIYGLDLFLGTIQWKTSTQKPVFSSPCVYQSGAMIVGSHDGVLRKIDSGSGRLTWSADLASPIFASPSVVRIENQSSNGETHGRLACCVATVSGEIYLLDERTGAVVLRANSKEGRFEGSVPGSLGEIFASPVIIDQYFLVATRSNYLYAFQLTQYENAKVPTN